jgi:hypothetical protein
VAYYRRYLTVDMWQIVQRQFVNHERKAKLVQFGQTLYGVFLLLLAVIGSVIFAFAVFE